MGAIRLADLVGVGDGRLGVVIGRTALGWIVEFDDNAWLVTPDVYKAVRA